MQSHDFFRPQGPGRRQSSLPDIIECLFVTRARDIMTSDGAFQVGYKEFHDFLCSLDYFAPYMNAVCARLT